MKSQKKVSRKKTARASHKTSVRRNSGRRSFRIRNKSRRGGMMRSARAVVGTLVYRDILPLINARRIIYNTGHDPKPDDGSITKEDERFYRTFVDIPVDSAIRTSINQLREEVKDPVKNADKMKLIKEKYDAIMKKLEEEKKKQLDNQDQKLMVVGKSFIPPSYQERLSLVDVGPLAAASGGESSLGPFINQPFTFSPNSQRYSDYSTQKVTPTKPPSKSVLRQKIPQDLEVTGTPLRNPFEHDVGPITSPNSPPPLSERQNKSNLLLSPGGVQKTFNFDDESE